MPSSSRNIFRRNAQFRAKGMDGRGGGGEGEHTESIVTLSLKSSYQTGLPPFTTSLLAISPNPPRFPPAAMLVRFSGCSGVNFVTLEVRRHSRCYSLLLWRGHSGLRGAKLYLFLRSSSPEVKRSDGRGHLDSDSHLAG